MLPPDESAASAAMNSCPNCGEVIDVSACAPYSRVLCPACNSAIRVRTEFLHFSLEKQIGEGGMSRVFLARDNTLGRQVALKILNQDYSQDAARTEQFEREARITAAISHPNVVKVFSVGHDQGHFFIAMELVGIGSLDEEIARTGGLDEARVLEIGAQLVKGLRAAYEQGLIHRDMKPGNVLFSDEQTVKIVDFGLALMFEKDVDESNEIWATPYYVPPEKLHKQPDDFRGDIYSLGASLFHALAGKPPYAADTSSLEALKAIKDKPVHLKDFAPLASAETCDLIDRMMARQPDDRHPSYSALLEHVEYVKKCLVDGGAPVRNVVVAPKRKPWLVPAIGAGITALVLGLSAVISGGDKSSGGGTKRPAVTDDTGISFDGGATTTTARKFVEARSSMLKGSLGEAAEGFREIIADSSTKQPTLNWARFNLGLCALIANEGKQADALFGKIAEEARFSEEEKDESLHAFFRQAGSDLSGGLPVLSESAEQYNPSGFECLGLLACALKDWQAGQFADAVAFFDAFRNAEPGGDGRWAAEYKSLPGDYEHDARLLAAVPLVERGASASEYRTVIDETRRILDALVLDGGAKEGLGKRLERLERTLARLERENRDNELLRMAELRERELRAFAGLRRDLHDHRNDFRFAEAVAELEKHRFEHPEVKELFEDELYVWRTADEFLNTLVADLNAKTYTGEIKRRLGDPMTATIFKASREELGFRLGGAAESRMPFSTVSNAGLLEIAQAMSMKYPNMLDYLKRRELLVIFAYQMGEVETALSAGEDLMADSRDFRARWLRITARRGS